MDALSNLFSLPLWIAAGCTLAAAVLAIALVKGRRAAAGRLAASEAAHALQLRALEKRQRVLFDRSLAGTYRSTIAGRLIDCNEIFANILGYASRQQALSRDSISESYRDASDRATFVALLKERRRLTGHECQMQRQDGWPVWVLENATLAVQEDGSEVIEGSILDVTERRQAQAALQRAPEIEAAARRAQEEFLASLSHEVRTPLHGIVGINELLLGSQATPAQREYFQLAQLSIDELVGAVNDVLDLAKLDAGQIELASVEFDLAGMIGELIADLGSAAHAKHIELSYEIPAETPSRLLGDGERLRQVLAKLIGNSIRYTDAGQVLVRVAIGESHQGRVQVQFTVADTGAGIAADQRVSLFDSFTSEEARRLGGSGLGMTIASRLVALMSGRMWAESDPSSGNQFHFAVGLGEAPAAVAGASAERVDLVGMPVLVAEADAINRRVLCDVVGYWGMRPLAVASGELALEALRAAAAAGERVPLVLLDRDLPIAMPSRLGAAATAGGLRLAKLIAEAEELGRPTVVVLSANGDSSREPGFDEAGVAAVLAKPIRQSKLRDTILSALGQSLGHPNPQLSAAAGDAAPSGNRAGLNVLLAEDNLVNRLMLASLLERDGHQVVRVGTGTEVLAAVAEQRFDVVLMDVQMPEVDGYTATRAIRERELGEGGHLPIFAVTANALRGDRERCLEAGMDGYLAKPVRAADLRRLLASLVEKGSGVENQLVLDGPAGGAFVEQVAAA